MVSERHEVCGTSNFEPSQLIRNVTFDFDRTYCLLLQHQVGTTHTYIGAAPDRFPVNLAISLLFSYQRGQS